MWLVLFVLPRIDLVKGIEQVLASFCVRFLFREHKA